MMRREMNTNTCYRMRMSIMTMITLANMITSMITNMRINMRINMATNTSINMIMVIHTAIMIMDTVMGMDMDTVMVTVTRT